MTGSIRAKAVDRDAALKLCEEIARADDVTRAARVHAHRAVKNDLSGKSLAAQLGYVAANVGAEYERRINDVLGVDTGNFDRGYCQVCGTRDDAHAHENGMVCTGCFDAAGEPEECARCGDLGYDGMRLDVIAWADEQPTRNVADEAAAAGLNPFTDEGERVRICKGCKVHY